MKNWGFKPRFTDEERKNLINKFHEAKTIQPELTTKDFVAGLSCGIKIDTFRKWLKLGKFIWHDIKKS